jgi:hypothetical protein
MNTIRLSYLLLDLSKLVLLLPTTALAADTTEAFNIGASDVDLYMGYDGVGLKHDEQVINGEIMLGYGMVENVSAFLGTALSGDNNFASESVTLYFGVFSTVFDSDHFDLDFSVSVTGENADASLISVTPALELNIDRGPELNQWGVYLRTYLPIFGREVEPVSEEEPTDNEIALRIESTAGAYYTIVEGNQLLLEYDMEFVPQPGEEERRVNVGSVAFGYNVAISDSVESINQVSVDIPQSGEAASIGFMIGLIATVPSEPSSSNINQKDNKQAKISQALIKN